MHPQQTTPSKISSTNELSGSKILIFEDNREIRDLLGLFFRQCGLIVAPAKNGLQAIRLFNEEKIDIVLTDICMPGINGNILAKQMKAIAEAIPIIAITGAPCLAENHFDRVLEKPFNLDLLLETVQAYLTGNTGNLAVPGLLQQREKFSGRKTNQH